MTIPQRDEIDAGLVAALVDRVVADVDGVTTSARRTTLEPTRGLRLRTSRAVSHASVAQFDGVWNVHVDIAVAGIGAPVAVAAVSVALAARPELRGALGEPPVVVVRVVDVALTRDSSM